MGHIAILPECRAVDLGIAGCGRQHISDRCRSQCLNVSLLRPAGRRRCILLDGTMDGPVPAKPQARSQLIRRLPDQVMRFRSDDFHTT
ncbi:hypothetical protein RGUI_0076 (plasmid) [Rhodovulum sp. P5]|nr:hypothetical protein RGUI_0076 [Rhodovulum sp. P5]